MSCQQNLTLWGVLKLTFRLLKSLKKERKVGQHVSPACLSDSIKTVCQMTNHACNPTKSMFAFCCNFCQRKGRIPLGFNSEIQVNVSKSQIISSHLLTKSVYINNMQLVMDTRHWGMIPQLIKCLSAAGTVCRALSYNLLKSAFRAVVSERLTDFS